MIDLDLAPDVGDGSRIPAWPRAPARRPRTRRRRLACPTRSPTRSARLVGALEHTRRSPPQPAAASACGQSRQPGASALAATPLDAQLAQRLLRRPRPAAPSASASRAIDVHRCLARGVLLGVQDLLGRRRGLERLVDRVLAALLVQAVTKTGPPVGELELAAQDGGSASRSLVGGSSACMMTARSSSGSGCRSPTAAKAASRRPRSAPFARVRDRPRRGPCRFSVEVEVLVLEGVGVLVGTTILSRGPNAAALDDVRSPVSS